MSEAMDELTFLAARLEYRQAERDYQEAFAAFEAAGWPGNSPLDYAVWSTAGYANSAERASIDLITN